MNKDLLNASILAFSFLALFGIAELLYHKLKIKAELTRKLVHLGTGLLVLLFPVMLGNQWLVLLLCLIFAYILIFFQKNNLLKSVNAIDRQSVGSLAYPVSVYLCYLAFDYSGHRYIYFYLPILLLAICDPVAALTGKRWPIGKYKVGKDYKTLTGSVMFFLSAIIVIIILSVLTKEEAPVMSLFLRAVVIAFFATFAEAFSRNGYDNIFVPLVALLILSFMNQL